MATVPNFPELAPDHNQATLLLKHIRAWLLRGELETDPEFLAAVADVFESTLEPHFRIEEERILPGIAAVRALGLVERVRAEHGLIRRLAAELRGGSITALRAFVDTLEAHISFEEREVYPVGATSMARAFR